jgi:hypothetical protein
MLSIGLLRGIVLFELDAVAIDPHPGRTIPGRNERAFGPIAKT